LIQRDAGLIVAQAPDGVVEDRDAAVDYFKRAVELGGSLDAIRAEPCIERMRENEVLAESLESSQPNIDEPARVVLPCTDPVLR
jgi:hypothetical protein